MQFRRRLNVVSWIFLGKYLFYIFLGRIYKHVHNIYTYFNFPRFRVQHLGITIMA